jgi:hypothetical protein
MTAHRTDTLPILFKILLFHTRDVDFHFGCGANAAIIGVPSLRHMIRDLPARNRTCFLKEV